METTYRRRPIEVALSPHGVFVLESRHAPGFRMAPERHDFLEIFYVLEGEGTFHIDGRAHPCHKGDIVVVPMGGLHRIEDDPTAPLAIYGICIAREVWKHEPGLLEHLPAGRLRVNKLLAAEVRADLRRMLFEQTLGRLGSRMLVQGLAQQMLALLVQRRLGAAHPPQPTSTPAQHREAVERYLAELPHRFFEATDLEQVAAELHMSRRRFTQLFRLASGTSWSAYVFRLRIDYACQLLRETSRGIIAIAFECGYEDLSSFYRAFKRQTGLPPRAWRQELGIRRLESGVRGQESGDRGQELGDRKRAGGGRNRVKKQAVRS